MTLFAFLFGLALGLTLGALYVDARQREAVVDDPFGEPYGDC